MKTYLIGILFLVCSCSPLERKPEITLTQEQKQKVAEIDSLLNFYHGRGILKGSVLVAQAGKVIYRKAFGYANMETQDLLIPESRFRIAS